MAAGGVLFAAYAVYALGSHAPAPEDLRAWASAMLIFIGIGIPVQIAIQILFHIALAIGIAANERDREENTIERMISSSVMEDERDKLISLKSSHVGYICAGAGFVAGLIALAAGISAAAALHIMIGSLAAGSLVEGCAAVYFHERGVHSE
jgi:hypothetical protein